jgi:dCMP deaminase
MTKENKYHKLYLDIAKRISEMSYSKRKQVGCCVVKDNNIISFGWNGTPAGFDNGCEDNTGTTKPEVIHAEMNAFSKLLKGGNNSIEGATLYLTLSPCWECSKIIIQSGIKRVVFLEEYRIMDSVAFLVDSGVEVYVFENGILKQY